MKDVTIEDVAEHADVSKATVSADAPERHTLQSELVIRSSSAPPPR